MIKAKAIPGEAAANYYAEKGRIPSAGCQHTTVIITPNPQKVNP